MVDWNEKIAQAKEVLKSKNKKSFNETGAFVSPPQYVYYSFVLLFLILNGEEKEWKGIQKQLRERDTQLWERILNFDSSEMSEQRLNRVHKYIKENGFGSEAVEQILIKLPSICPPVVKWCLAVSRYE